MTSSSAVNSWGRRLEHKVAIVTGGTSGIGHATALRFYKEGAHVVFTGRRQALGQGLLEEHFSRGPQKCLFVRADHTKPDDCQRVIDDTVAAFGRIDILFNNAGRVTLGTAETTSDETWQATLDLNVTSVWRMSKLVLPIMKAQATTGGVIVNNGSDWSVVGACNALPYIVSKGAVAMMTKAMAMDCARQNIRINCVCPGDTFVERWEAQGYFEGSQPVTKEQAQKDAAKDIPMGRLGTVDEIANAVLFLASDESSFMTGHLLMVDGGNTAR